MTVYFTKLISGEDIIAETEFMEAKGMPVVVLKNPVQVVAGQSITGEFGYQLVPWLPFVKDHTVPVSADTVMTQTEIDTKMLNEYSTIAGTGIQIPDNKIVIG